MKIGFANFLECLNLYLQQQSQQSNITYTSGDKVIIYGSVTLENGIIMRSTNRFHNRSWFSNISVRMNSEELLEYFSDEGHICYGQVLFIKYITYICFFINNYNNYSLNSIKTLLIATIKIIEQDTTLNLALIQWYDFKGTNSYCYECPLLKLTDCFNFIDVEAIQDIVHIVPRFNSNNEYFVNKFIYV